MSGQCSSMVWLAVCTVAVSAAGPPQPTSPKPAEVTVLRGCLLDSRADTTTADRKGVIYTLDVARGTAQQPSAPGAGASAVAKTRYALSTRGVEGSVNFAKHVGHEVEVTGQVLERMQTLAPSTKAEATAPAPKPLPGAAQHMFQVSALKMISAKCP